MEEPTPEQALRVAARDGDSATVIRLLDAGTPVDAADMIGYTPLMLAARKGQTTMLRLLIERGADWKAKNRPKNTALDYAVQSGVVDAVRFLLEQETQIPLPTVSIARMDVPTSKSYGGHPERSTGITHIVLNHDFHDEDD